MAEVDRLLRHQDVRLVTLTGPGGVGKTRLAIAVAAELADVVEDGVAFVALAPISAPELVGPTIAQALGAGEASDGSPTTALIEHLRDRHLLLVLDNFEHVLAAAPLVIDLLCACPRLRVLVTSRARLNLSGEHDFAVPPLAVPGLDALAAAAAIGSALPAVADALPVPARLREFAAVRLFVERAHAASPAFALTVDNAAAVAEVCRRLDGLPLAIELAAARTKVLSPAALLARLTNRLHLLTGGPRDAPARLRSLHDAIAWSHNLLSPEEQALFRRLSVFVGGFTLEAAEVVAVEPGAENREPSEGDARPPPPRPSVLDLVVALVDGSLVQRGEGVDGEARFALLAMVREFALEALEASGEAAAVRDAHAAWCLAFAERADPELSGPDQAVWFRRLEVEHANLRAALGWFRERGDAERGLRLAAALSWFWSSRGYLREARDWLDGFLAMADTATDAARAQALLEAGNIAHWQGEWERADVLYEQSQAAWQALGDRRKVAIAMRCRGSSLLDRGDPERASALVEESFARLREVDDGWDVAFATLLLGRVASARGDHRGAVERFGEAAALFREVGDRSYVAAAAGEQGFALLRAGDAALARAAYAEALALAEEVTEPWRVVWSLSGCAELALADGDPARAARLLGSATALRRAVGASKDSRLLAADDRVAAAARAALGDERFAAAFERGRALPVSAAIAEAHAVVARVPSAGPPAAAADPTPALAPGGLTRRERDVLRLLAEGRSDKEIAATLLITRRTASQHVAAILAKLGVDSRAAAAIAAIRNGIV